MDQSKPSIWVFQHVACEPLGAFRDPLQRGGASVRTIRVYAGESSPRTLAGCDGLIVLGGPMSVNDRSRLAYLRAELRLLEGALCRDLPALGVCLGAQLLAHAAGGRVYRGREPELGWYPIQWTPGARRVPWCQPTGRTGRRAPSRLRVFHWHGETFTLPRGAVRLAGSERFRNQAFLLGRHAVGLQFHLEVTAPMIRSWCRVYRDEWRAYCVANRTRRAPDQHVDDLRRLGRLAEACGEWFAEAVVRPQG